VERIIEIKHKGYERLYICDYISYYECWYMNISSQRQAYS